MTATSDAGKGILSGPPALVGVDEAETAHRLVPLACDVERFGIASCGYPAEYLTIVHDLNWSEVQPSRRCPHCAESDPGSAYPNGPDQTLAHSRRDGRQRSVRTT